MKTLDEAVNILEEMISDDLPDWAVRQTNDAIEVIEQYIDARPEPVMWRCNRNGCFVEMECHKCGCKDYLDSDKLYAEPPPPAVPDGYVLVPKEPTKAMIDRAMQLRWPMSTACEENHRVAIYKYMIAAAKSDSGVEVE